MRDAHPCLPCPPSARPLSADKMPSATKPYIPSSPATGATQVSDNMMADFI